MRHSYVDQSPSPAILMLACEVHVPGRPDLSVKLKAKIDTGSDMTAIPRGVGERRGLVRFSRRYIRQTGKFERTYLLRIDMDGRTYSVETVANDASYVLIGRDILNQLTLIADGPNEVFELLAPGNK